MIKYNLVQFKTELHLSTVLNCLNFGRESAWNIYLVFTIRLLWELLIVPSILYLLIKLGGEDVRKRERHSFHPKWIFSNFTEGPASISVVLETSQFLFKTTSGSIMYLLVLWNTVKQYNCCDFRCVWTCMVDLSQGRHRCSQGSKEVIRSPRPIVAFFHQIKNKQTNKSHWSALGPLDQVSVILQVVQQVSLSNRFFPRSAPWMETTHSGIKPDTLFWSLLILCLYVFSEHGDANCLFCKVTIEIRCDVYKVSSIVLVIYIRWGLVNGSHNLNAFVTNIIFFPIQWLCCLISFLKLGFYNEQSVFLPFYSVGSECFFGVVELCLFLCCWVNLILERGDSKPAEQELNE